jgi:toxin ParE1/3/4
MYSFKLNTQAEEDLTRIFEYGMSQFGLEQADRYYEMFF